MPRERLSALASIPDDVTDPLLWRLALDVAAAHQPDEDGNCRNLQCVSQRGMCSAVRHARRAMACARSARQSAPHPSSAALQGRAAVPIRQVSGFRGWFRASAVAEAGLPLRRIAAMPAA
ncbi:hypothetical protein GCM10027280_57290 [Micromonospora polyrhachis]